MPNLSIISPAVSIILFLTDNIKYLIITAIISQPSEHNNNLQFNPTYNPFNTGSSSQPSTKSVDKWKIFNGLKSQRSQETELFTSEMACFFYRY